MDIDHTDATLVAALQANGRASYESLGQLVGLSRIAARGRVQRLIDTGAVGVATIVHPAARGLHAYGHLALSVQGAAAPVAEAIALMPQFPLVSLVAGPCAVIAEARTTDMETLREAIQQVRALPGVRQVASCIYTQRLKDRHSGRRTTGPALPVVLDDVDRALIEQLELDGRASYADLGARVRLSASSARARVLRLLDEGILHVGAMVQLGSLGLGHMCGFGVAAADVDGTRALEGIAEIASVQYLTECLGSWDAIGTMLCASPEEVAATLDQIRITPGVHQVDAWTHLRVLKEDYRGTPDQLKEA